MAPTRTFCPNLAWAARGPTGPGNIGIHSRKEQRFMGTECRKTLTATPGTALSRLRPSAETVSFVVTLMAHGCPLPAIVVAFGSDERTVACGLARAGVQGQAVPQHRVAQPRDLGQVQADAIRVHTPGGIVWLALAMMVGPRLWLAGEVSEQRDRPLLRRLSERVRPWAARRPLLVGTAGLVSSSRALRETLREPVPTGQGGRPRLRPWRHGLIAQVVKRSERRRVGEIDRRLIDGTPARVETLRRRSQGDGGINTASMERLNATFRERLAPLARRSRALVRRTLTLQPGMYLIGTVYHFCTPHASLAHAGRGLTPAMAAGITAHCGSVRELLSCHGPPPRGTPPTPRGRPSHALKYLMERWSGDHG